MTERQVKDKYTFIGVTSDNIDQKLQEMVAGVKRDIAFQGYGNVKITTVVTKMSWKEDQLYIDVNVSVKDR